MRLRTLKMYLNKNDLAKQLNKQPKDVVIGFTCSTFDLLHTGHLMMLQQAKEKCDYLICGLLVDPTADRKESKNKPVQSVFERYMQLSACKYVDEVIPFEHEEDICNMIKLIEPDIRIVGEEYKNTEHTGKGLCPIYYNHRRHNFSSSELRQRVAKAEAQKAQE